MFKFANENLTDEDSENKDIENENGTDDLKNNVNSNVCKKCLNSFNSLRGLQIHMARCKPEANGFNCNVCDKTFTQKIKLKEHFETQVHKDALKLKNLGEENTKLLKNLNLLKQELKSFQERKTIEISELTQELNILRYQNKTSLIQKLQFYLFLVLEKNKFYEKELEKQRFIVSDLLKEQHKMFCELFKDLKTK